ncbi:hypothetical protein BLOT_001291 [Blomia tropicalis]|nr:hypothetical protein BLOT_001291 [Blomia tropicalis]
MYKLVSTRMFMSGESILSISRLYISLCHVRSHCPIGEYYTQLNERIGIKPITSVDTKIIVV